MADVSPGILPLSTDFDESLSKLTLRDLFDIVSRLIEDSDQQQNFVQKGEVTADNMLTVYGDINLSPQAVRTLANYLGL